MITTTPAGIKATLKEMGIKAFVRNIAKKNLFKIRVEGEKKVERDFTDSELSKVMSLVNALNGTDIRGEKLEFTSYFKVFGQSFRIRGTCYKGKVKKFKV